MVNKFSKLTANDLLNMLDKLYDDLEKSEEEIKRLLLIREQIIEDKEMMELAIMYKSNREYRGRRI